MELDSCTDVTLLTQVQCILQEREIKSMIANISDNRNILLVSLKKKKSIARFFFPH